MNVQQLEYIVALNKHRNFVKAAEHCHVTQPTLTMMVKKLEEELELELFDRSSQPLKPTAMGELIIAKAARILAEINQLKDFARAEKDVIEGEYRLGVIPTLAPYLLPRFLPHFLKENPGVNFTIIELQTEELVRRLKQNELDLALLVTPLEEKEIREVPVFYEPIMVYTSESMKMYEQEKIEVKKLTTEELWLLDEGHCFRSQVLNLCKTAKSEGHMRIQYQSGSLETLKAMVDNNIGYTLVPELAANVRSKKTKRFLAPEPVREVSIAVYHSFYKEKLLSRLQQSIQKSLPEHFKKNDKVIKVKWR